MYLRGEPQWKIAQHFGVHPGQISRDLRAIQKQWQEKALFNHDQVKARELAKLDEIEHKAWLAWERSCKDIGTMEVTGSNQGGKSKPEKVKKITNGQAGDARFLATILDCVKRRCEILGLNAAEELRHSGSLCLNLTDEQRLERINALIERARARRDAQIVVGDTRDCSGKSSPPDVPRPAPEFGKRLCTNPLAQTSGATTSIRHLIVKDALRFAHVGARHGVQAKVGQLCHGRGKVAAVGDVGETNANLGLRSSRWGPKVAQGTAAKC
jgi:hypothetical protein